MHLSTTQINLTDKKEAKKNSYLNRKPSNVSGLMGILGIIFKVYLHSVTCIVFYHPAHTDGDGAHISYGWICERGVPWRPCAS